MVRSVRLKVCYVAEQFVLNDTFSPNVIENTLMCVWWVCLEATSDVFKGRWPC